MRLKQNELIGVKLYRSEEVPSDYVGTKKRWLDSGVVLCQCQPAENLKTVELYGVQVKDMKTLYIDVETEIDESYGISFRSEADKPEYLVKSVKDYSTHKVVLVGRGD